MSTAVVAVTVLAMVMIIAMWGLILNNIGKSLGRLERAVERVEAAAELVATDLAQSQQRADDISTGIPGEAADAGAQSGTTQGGTDE